MHATLTAVEPEYPIRHLEKLHEAIQSEGIGELIGELGQHWPESSPGLHALTVCDYHSDGWDTDSVVTELGLRELCQVHVELLDLYRERLSEYGFGDERLNPVLAALADAFFAWGVQRNDGHWDRPSKAQPEMPEA